MLHLSNPIPISNLGITLRAIHRVGCTTRIRAPNSLVTMDPWDLERQSQTSRDSKPCPTQLATGHLSQALLPMNLEALSISMMPTICMEVQGQDQVLEV